MFKIIKNFFRDLDDWFYEKLNRNHVLFVLTSGAGFACQAPLIRELLKYDNVKVGATTDRVMPLEEIEFVNDVDRELFIRLYVPFRKAIWLKYNLIVNSYLNGYYPRRRGLQVYMHHGTSYGSSGSNLPNAEQHDIYFGLAQVQRDYFESLSPGIFEKSRAFFAIGSPKTDALVNGKYNKQKTLAELGLPDQPTILITSHWSKYSTLSVFGNKVFKEVSSAFPECNVIQTGHPWLWTTNKNIDRDWCEQLSSSLQCVEKECLNALFLPSYTVEPLLSIADILIADHSSVITMYSLLDRPIVFFNNLVARNNNVGKPEIIGKYIDASHVFSDIDQLVDSCQTAFNKPDEKKRGRHMLREAFFANAGQSSKTAANILSQIGGVYSVKSPRWEKVLKLSQQMSEK